MDGSRFDFAGFSPLLADIDVTLWGIVGIDLVDVSSGRICNGLSLCHRLDDGDVLVGGFFFMDDQVGDRVDLIDTLVASTSLVGFRSWPRIFTADVDHNILALSCGVERKRFHVKLALMMITCLNIELWRQVSVRFLHKILPLKGRITACHLYHLYV